MLKKFFVLTLLSCLAFANADAEEKSEGIAMIETKFSNDNLEDLMSGADINTIENLKQSGFDFNGKDVFGNPPLYYLLAKNPDLEVARKAIEYGADVNLPAANGMLPLNIATSKANEMQLQILMMKTLGLDVTEPQVQESLKENLYREMSRMAQMARLLIENGADVNRESTLGTPLTNAVTNAWNMEIVEMLLKAGADPNRQDKNGQTPLFYAAAGGNDDIVALLLKSGADPDIKDNAGKVYLDVEKVKMDSIL